MCTHIFSHWDHRSLLRLLSACTYLNPTLPLFRGRPTLCSAIPVGATFYLYPIFG